MAEANDSLGEDHREGTKTQVSCQRSARKNSEQLLSPPSLCSSFEGVPCDLPDPTLRLTEGTTSSAHLPRSHGSVPAASPPLPPLPSSPASPSLRCQEVKDGSRRGRGEVGWRGLTSRRDSPSGFSSVPGHCTLLAGILFTHTQTH